MNPNTKQGFAISALLLLLILGLSSFAHATYPSPVPTPGTATVDGLTSEWNLAQDYSAPIYVQGNPAKAQVANAYLRYDALHETVYVLVLGMNLTYWPVDASDPSNAWAHILGSPPHPWPGTKVYGADSGNDGTPPDFAYVYDGSEAIGYEASFKWPPGEYKIVIHIEVLDTSSNLNTGATSGFHAGIDLVLLAFVIPFNPLGPIMAVVPMIAVLGGYVGIRRHRFDRETTP